MRTIFRLFGFTARHRALLLGAYASLIGATLLSLVIPRLLGLAVDRALGAADLRVLAVLAGAVLVISILRGAFGYAQQYLAEALSQRVSYDLRKAFFQRLMALSFAFHDRQHTGDLMSRATSDVENIRWFVSFGPTRAATILILVGGATALMVSLDPGLGLLALAVTPTVMGIAIFISRKTRTLWRSVQDEEGRLITVLQENIAGARVVRAFGSQPFEEGKFNRRAERIADQTFDASKLQSLNSTIVALAFNVVIGTVLWIGGGKVLRGEMTAGALTQFILYLGMMAFPVRMTGFMVNNFARAMSAGDRLFQVFDAVSPVDEKPSAGPLPAPLRGHVRFEGVVFSYRPGVEALQGVDLEVPPGRRVALLGRAGSGKSTLAMLVPRFYDPTEGRVLIDGVDVRDATLASVRSAVGMVFQDVFLFSASIRENIAYGRPDATMERVVEAARAAQLHDFVASLPDGYETEVGERGITLSGGQRQRLAIARTLVLDPPILILDDSTSSVDAATEREIQRALERVMEGRTTVIIAHRVSSLRAADEVLVLDQGRVLDRGTHDHLLRHSAFYREVHRLQVATGGEQPDGAALEEAALHQESITSGLPPSP